MMRRRRRTIGQRPSWTMKARNMADSSPTATSSAHLTRAVA